MILMKKTWSKDWNASSQPRKQRKYIRKAPLHIKSKFLGCHLNRELRQKYGTRSVPVRKGDKVKVMVGTHKGRTGKVERVDRKRGVVFIAKIEQIKKDGTKSQVPLKASNLMITDLNTEDKRRLKPNKTKAEETKSG